MIMIIINNNSNNIKLLHKSKAKLIEMLWCDWSSLAIKLANQLCQLSGSDTYQLAAGSTTRN